MSNMHDEHKAEQQSHLVNAKAIYADDDTKPLCSHSDKVTNAPGHNDVDSELSSDVPPVTASFPEKLMYILDNEDIHGNTASWLPDGRSFVIRNPHRFAEEVLPHFFRRGCKFNSFMRKLYYWGFKKTKSKGQGAEVKFHHKDFCRGSAPSCMHLRTLQRSFEKPENSKSTASSKMGAFDDDQNIDGNMSTLSEETESSIYDSDDAQTLRMVKEAMDIYDQNNNMDAAPSRRRSLPPHPQVTRQAPNHFPLLMWGGVNSTPFTSLPFVDNRLQPPARENNILLDFAASQQLGNNLQRSMAQTQLLTTTNQARQVLRTNPLSLAPTQETNAALLLSRYNMLSTTAQPNSTQFSYCLNNVSKLRRY